MKYIVHQRGGEENEEKNTFLYEAHWKCLVLGLVRYFYCAQVHALSLL